MGKLFRRGRVWYAWVRERSGRWSRVSTHCIDRAAARAVLRQLERDAADPAERAARTTTTARVLSDYAASRVRVGRAAGSLHHVRTKSANLLALLPTQAAEITHAAVERYIDARLAEDVRRTTVKKELRVLKAALGLARRNALWSGEPEAVIHELADDYRPRERSLSPWELVALLGELAPERACRVAWIVATGARWSESVRARPEDIDRATGTVRLRGTKRPASWRRVPVRGLGAQVLAWSLAQGAPPFAPWGNVRRDLGAACARAGIAPVTPNDLRRTFSMWLREAGVEPQLIGAAMGHADSRMVERVYGRLSPTALAALLEQRLGLPPTSDPRRIESTRKLASRNEDRRAATGLKIPVSAVRFRPCAPEYQADSGDSLPSAEHAAGAESSPAQPTYIPPAWVLEATANLACLLAGVSP